MKRFWLIASLALGLAISATLTFRNPMVSLFLATVYLALVVGIGEVCYVGTLHALRKVLLEDAECEKAAKAATEGPVS